MARMFLHEHTEFSSLLSILARKTTIDPFLIEKDYWIMQELYGLQMQGLSFELKGGTSLSKGFQLIHRFSEDLDILIHAPAGVSVNENRKNTKPSAVESRRMFYDWLSEHLEFPGIIKIERDHDFDDVPHYRSGGIRLYYESYTSPLQGVKEGILLEAGFDATSPNQPVTISSWAYDRALDTPGLELMDNRAIGVTCYDYEYTFVEKLQTIATKYRREQEGAEKEPNFMRQYYDVYCLLDTRRVQTFLDTPAYQDHKAARFPAADLAIPIAENQAFRLDDPKIRETYRQRYEKTKALYYKGQPPFDELLNRIGQFLHQL